METRPPGGTNGGGGIAAKSGEWRSATLQPTTTQPQSTNDVPIAPPRRKRMSLYTNKDGRPGGFKDVFGNFTRRSSCESTQSTDWATLKKRRNSSSDIHSDEFCDFSKDLPTDKPGIRRKISKVGNKKSDKFFGENLSDCLSDEPVAATDEQKSIENLHAAKKEDTKNVVATHEKDDIDTFIEHNVHQETAAKVKHENASVAKEAEMMNISGHKRPAVVDMINDSLDKKAEFLLAMLEQADNSGAVSSQYRPKPVDEQIIVPKRKHGRHICDDDEKLKLIFQATNVHHHDGHDTVDGAIKSLEASEKLVEKKQQESSSNAAPTVTPPPSPTTPNPYEHMEPVEEPLIVPRRSVRKHICDDDDHMHKMVHETSASEKLVVNKPTVNATILSPKKPDRDFTRYRKSLDLSEPPPPPPPVERPARRSLSRENLPTPPPRPCKSNNSQKPPPQPVGILSKSLSHNDTFSMDPNMAKTTTTTTTTGSFTMPPIENIDDQQMVSILKKCNSNHSFLTPDLMDQIVNKVYGFQMNWNDHDCSHYSEYNDCSGEVAPSSKLKTRKISTIRKDFVEKPIAEEIEEPSAAEERPSFSIGGTGIVKSDKNYNDLATLGGDSLAISNLSTRSSSSPPRSSSPQPDETVVYSITKGTAETINPSKKEAISTTEKTASEQLQPQQIIQRSSTVLEIKPTTASVVKPKPSTAVNIESLIESISAADANMNTVLEDIYSTNKSILGDFQQYLEEAQFTDKLFSALKQQELENKEPTLPSAECIPITIDAANDDDDDVNDDEENQDSGDDLPPAKWLARLKNPETNRRGSIVEHDEWFSEHRGVSDIRAFDFNLPRRGSCQAYDTRKLFPFGGREKTLSESSEFFVSDELKMLSKSSDHINANAGVTASGKSSLAKEKSTAAVDNKNEQLDHSTLLKFFDKNATAV